MPNFFDRFDPSAATANPRLAGAQAEATIKGAQAGVAPAMTEADLALKRAQARVETTKAEAAEKAAKPQKPDLGSTLSLNNTARHARELSKNWFATGFGAETAQKFGGTSARSIAADLEKLKANEAINQINELSKQGIKLTPLSDSDMRLLASMAVSTDIGIPDEDFQNRMNKLIDISRKIYIAGGGDVRDTYSKEDLPYIKEELAGRRKSEQR